MYFQSISDDYTCVNPKSEQHNVQNQIFPLHFSFNPWTWILKAIFLTAELLLAFYEFFQPFCLSMAILEAAFQSKFPNMGEVIYCSFFFFFQMVESGIYVHLGSLVLLSCREGWRGWLYYILTESFNVASVALKRRLVSSVLELRLSLESLLSNNSGEVMLLWFPQWRFSQVPWAFIVMRCVQTWCFRKLFDIVWNWLVVSLVFRHGQAVWINLIFLSNDV